MSRRILSLWFPRLDAERLLRGDPSWAGRPFAVAGNRGGTLRLASVSAAAEAAGLAPGMALADAAAICPDLVTRPEAPAATARFLEALARWAGRFSPWVAPAEDGLLLDVTGCAALFGGEPGLVAEAMAGAAALGLTLRAGLADTVGAAWAVARFTDVAPTDPAAGDAIDQEARATRSRAHRRRGIGAATPEAGPPDARIVPPGEGFVRLAPLPVAALRLDPATVAGLRTLGLGRIGDLVPVPRAQLARRCGEDLVRRLDQALGRLPEPVSPTPPPPTLALRLGFPDPIGRSEDVLAGLDRLLPALCARLVAAGRGARGVRLTLVRTDRAALVREVRLARPASTPRAIRPLLALQLDGLDAGFGIEAMRLQATVTDPLAPPAPRWPPAGRPVADGDALADLLGRLGARPGMDAVLRLHPADSHIPEKAATEMAAAFSPAARFWPAPATVRPALLLDPPEPLAPRDTDLPPEAFLWRRRLRRRAAAFGPERITAEWWLDDPAWRSGARDYWRVETAEGARLWLYRTTGTAGATDMAADWFVHGLFP